MNLKNLKRLTYQTSDNKFQDWHIKQLEQLPINHLEEICFDYIYEVDMEKWAQVDGILVGNKFRSLYRVDVCPESNLQYLPKLYKKGVLEFCQYSHWTL